MTGSQKHITAILLVLSFLPATALALSSEDEAAREAALQWLIVLDARKYNDAAQMMSQEIRQQRDWRNYFATHRAPLGEANNRHFVEVKNHSTVPGAVGVRTYAVLRFKTSFEHGAAVEEIVMAKMACCWEVFEYKVSDL
jgi:Protein of unknown function (DUF4019)